MNKIDEIINLRKLLKNSVDNVVSAYDKNDQFVIYWSNILECNPKELILAFARVGAIDAYEKYTENSIGKTVYIPKRGTRADKEKRNAEIKSLFTGENCEMLSKKYNLTAYHIRRIAKSK